METKTFEIRTIEGKIRRISADIQQRYVMLGNEILEDQAGEYKSVIKSNNLAELAGEIMQITAGRDEAIKKKESISAIKHEINNLDKEVKEVLKNSSELEKENSKHYIGIAETIYEFYKVDPVKMSTYEQYFIEVIAIDRKNQEIDRKIQEIEIDRKPSVFGKLLDSGEKGILNSKKKYNNSVMQSNFRAAGEKMCKEKVYENNINTDIDGLFESYKTNLKTLEDLSAQLEALMAEKNNHKSEIEEIMQELNNDPDSFIKNIESERNNRLEDFGEKIYKILAPSIETSGSSGIVNSQVSEITRLSKEKDELYAKNEALKTQIEIAKIEDDIKSHKSFIEKKNQRINDLKTEIKEHNEKIEECQNLLDRLKAKSTAESSEKQEE